MDNSLIFSGDIPRSTISGMLRRGAIVGLGHGLYTSDTDVAPELVVRRNWATIAGRLFPDATVTDRSAPRSGPVDGVLYLAHDAREREVHLPGLTISARRGAPPQPGDIDIPGGLHLASRGRALAENAVPSRSRGGHPSRKLTRAELGDWIDHLCLLGGEKDLNTDRDQARQLADVLGISASALSNLDSMIGATLGTKEGANLPRSLQARKAGHPYDQERAQLFDRLVTALRESPPQSLPARTGNVYLPFYEAYFSNFIEGTEFTVDEALRIVFDNNVPVGREGDAHDVVGTYLVVSDDNEMARLATTPEEFLDLLKTRHATVMAGRPDKHPGEFKTLANQAGATHFVAPTLVEGTLIEGYRRLADLDTPWERSVLAMFVVSEVHLFDDGNGRTARIMMNAELEAGKAMRTIIPTVFREDYLGALRLLSRGGEPSALIKAMRYANDWTSRIDFSDSALARQQMEATHAFELPEPGVHLVLPNVTLFGPPIAPDAPEAVDDKEPVDWAVQPYKRQDGTPVRGYRRQTRR